MVQWETQQWNRSKTSKPRSSNLKSGSSRHAPHLCTISALSSFLHVSQACKWAKCACVRVCMCMCAPVCVYIRACGCTHLSGPGKSLPRNCCPPRGGGGGSRVHKHSLQLYKESRCMLRCMLHAIIPCKSSTFWGSDICGQGHIGIRHLFPMAQRSELVRKSADGALADPHGRAECLPLVRYQCSWHFPLHSGLSVVLAKPSCRLLSAADLARWYGWLHGQHASR